MKIKSLFLLLTAVMLMVAAIVLYLSDVLDHSIRITVRESEETYSLDARYHQQDGTRVAQYIDSCLQKEAIFHGAQKVDALLVLDDHTRFTIKAVPGRLKIALNRNENSSASFQRIKQMCQGIVKIIKK